MNDCLLINYKMEKIIRLPEDNTIISSKELDSLNSAGEYEGIILVKDEYGLIGSVHALDEDYWHFETFSIAQKFDSLEEIIIAYPAYTFIYVTE